MKEIPIYKKSSNQPIAAGVVGAALLVSSVVAYILKMYAIAVVVGIVGLACVSYALYNALKPGTKIEKVESVEQSTADLNFKANIFTTQKILKYVSIEK